MKRNQRNRIRALTVVMVVGWMVAQAAIADGAPATIIVDDPTGSTSTNGLCSINEAIINANDDAQALTDCVAGFGADTIILTVDVTLTNRFVTVVGQNATKSIESTIIIDGQGHTLRRDPSTACLLDGVPLGHETRLLHVSTPLGNLEVKNITLEGGCADHVVLNELSSGGAILNQGRLSVANTTVLNNRALSAGGGIFNDGEITSISNTTFSGNSAANGGGIFNDFSISAIRNTTFSVNTADAGGGIFNHGEVLSILNSTFHANSALLPDFGSGIHNGGILEVNASIFAQALAGGGDCRGLFVFGGGNLSDGTCPGNAGTATNVDAVLSDNGGPTLTHALLAGSNAINLAGNCGLATDQRGAPRFDGNCDIGAFEFGGCPVLELDFGTVVAVETYEECEIRVGPSFTVAGPGGDLTLTGGKQVVLRDGFGVQTDGTATIGIDPDLQVMTALEAAANAGWVAPRQ